jgi:hypothetical protein
MKRPELTNPCPKPKTIAPSIPLTVLLKAPIKYIPAWETEE